MPSFACFRRLFWRTPSTLKFLNQVRPEILTAVSKYFLFTSGMAEAEEGAGPLPEKSNILQVI